MNDKSSSARFIKLVSSNIKFRLFLLKELPMAFLAGIRVKEITEEKAVITIPYKFLTKNPFRSMYFACLSMAAELSTGLLCAAAAYGSKPKVSTLVLGIKGNFSKKAVGLVTFTCNDGKAIALAVHESISTGEGKTYTATSIGIDESGEQVADFRFTWSFKPKNKI